MITATSTDNITIGDHYTATFFGLTFNIDTMWTTGVAMLIILALALALRSRITSGVPGKLQLFFEVVVGAVQAQVEEAIGISVAPFVVPMAAALFLFILISNWLAIFPAGHQPDHLPPATADVNTTFALSFLVMGTAIVTGIRKQGFGHWFKNYFKPNPIMFPINVIEEIVKPFSLGLRLFGNLFAGGIMLLIISLLPWYIAWAPTAAWKLFDMFIGLVQAFIFALLTILYFAYEIGGH